MDIEGRGPSHPKNVRGIGVDILSVARIEKILKSGDRGFFERVFTEEETVYCESKKRPALHYAARFAAKEAFFKALGTGWRGGMKWRDVRVDHDSLGKPHIVLDGVAQKRFVENGYGAAMLSISHSREFAVAFVLILGE